MLVEHIERPIIETDRPYSGAVIFEDNQDSYLVDNAWALRLIKCFDNKAKLLFVTDLYVIREKILKQGIVLNGSSEVSGVRLGMNRGDDVVYLGSKYKLTLYDPKTYRLQSTEPLRIEPVSQFQELEELVKAKLTSSRLPK